MVKLVLLPVSRALISERIRFENPWWETGDIEADYARMPKRLYFDFFFKRLADKQVRRAVVLMGPRRVGKTVMMHQAIAGLLKTGINPKKIAFINVENPIFINTSLDSLLKHVLETSGEDSLKDSYVFFDEIQYLTDWEVQLKVLVDSYRECRFIVSGSAAATLVMKSRESGAGRFTDFMLPPLTFQEYLAMKGKDTLVYSQNISWEKAPVPFFNSDNMRELNKEFIAYLNFGGYPEVIFSESVMSDPGLYIRSDIIDKVLLRDLPGLYGITNVQELYRLFTVLAYNSSAEMSYQSLSSESGISKKMIMNYLTYLESAYLIKRINRVDETAKNMRRNDYFKVYLTNPSLRTALFSPLDPLEDAMGPMVETGIFAQWLHRDWNIPQYARWTKSRFQGEVDMVALDDKKLKPKWAVEIKWSNRYVEHVKELKSLTYFCEENKLKHATVTTIDKFTELKYKDITFHFIPAALYAYAIGANTLSQKQI